MKIKPVSKEQFTISKIMLFPPRTRLMCPECCIVSSTHLCSDLFIYQYFHSPTFPPSWVCHHTCHRCGYKDDHGRGFTDSGNYECEETKDLYKWEQEDLPQLEDELAELKHKIAKGKARWAELWDNKEDAS